MQLRCFDTIRFSRSTFTKSETFEETSFDIKIYLSNLKHFQSIEKLTSNIYNTIMRNVISIIPNTKILLFMLSKNVKKHFYYLFYFP